MTRNGHGFLVTLVLASVGCAQSASAPRAPANAHVASGGEQASSARDVVQRVPVNGHSLFIACRGAGTPTIVLETGFTDPGLAWGREVFRGAADVSRACVYDRAGLGYSDARQDVTDSGKIADDLHALLSGARVLPPYVLVGHSIGGMHVRVFDRAHPGEVVGMVLVDASHPDQFVRAQQRLSAADWATMERSVRNAHADPKLEPLDWARSSALAREAGSLGSRPLRVLSHAKDFRQPCFGTDCISAEGSEIWESLWQELQIDLASLSSDSAHVFIPGSGHYIQAHAPAQVIEAITAVIDRARCAH